jgi:hypothetical protein
MPHFCSCCGNDLAAVPQLLIGTRKVIDIPVVKPSCTAHHTYRKICPCGQVCDADFPAHVVAAVQYGPQIESLEHRLWELLHVEVDKTCPKARTLQKSLRRHPDYILYFLHDPDVPPDNNGSERAIRNVKVKQKIFGQFRSARGADGFAVIRSIIDTTIKSGQNVLNALSLIAAAGTE